MGKTVCPRLKYFISVKLIHDLPLQNAAGSWQARMHDLWNISIPASIFQGQYFTLFLLSKSVNKACEELGKQLIRGLRETVTASLNL